MKKAGNTQSEIAQALGFSQGTVSKKQKRNTGKRGYSEKQSQKLAEERLKLKSTKIPIIVGDLEQEVTRCLRLKHSPEQISIGLKRLNQNVSYETIYSFIIADRQG